MMTRTIDGVTTDVATAMAASGATVLTEDGLLLRTCEHGIRHPVGHLDRTQIAVSRHERAGRYGGVTLSKAETTCGCCAACAAPALSEDSAVIATIA